MIQQVEAKRKAEEAVARQKYEEKLALPAAPNSFRELDALRWCTLIFEWCAIVCH